MTLVFVTFIMNSLDFKCTCIHIPAEVRGTMSRKNATTFLEPWVKNMKIGLSALDGMRYVQEAMSFQELLEYVNESRVRSNLNLDPLPSNVKIPLGSESFWNYLLKLAGPQSNRVNITLKKLSSKSLEGAVHLLEYLELLYLVHKVPYDDINNTFLFYGNVINKRINKRRKQDIVMDHQFWTFRFSTDDIKDGMKRPPGKHTSPMSIAILEWTANYIQEQEGQSSPSRVHVASIRSVFIEARPAILTYMWPSIMHFQSFPKDRETYIIPIVTGIHSGVYEPSVGHATLAVAVVDATRETGTLQLYDPAFNSDYLPNLELVRRRLIQCEVGGVKKWKLAAPEDRFYKAPEQSNNMCTAACCCFCLWKSGIDGFQDWGTVKNLTWVRTSNWWWKYRQLVCQVIQNYVQNLDEAGLIHWTTDKETGVGFTDPSLLYKFPSMKPRNILFSSNIN
jgi:hypothetical protein